MSGADYLHCAVCGAKALYDADVNYDYPNLGALVALCKRCRMTHALKPVSDAESAAHDADVRKASLATLDAVMQNVVTDPRVRADGLLNQIMHDFKAALGDAPRGGE